MPIQPKRSKKISCIVFLLLLFSLSIHAQTDTSYYDLGRGRIKRDFSQAMVIKARDLRPFFNSSIDDLVKARLGYANDLVYVIDGNAINNIDNYSIYDIEEIVILDNALGTLNGAYAAKFLVLVKTNRGKEMPEGFTLGAAAKTGIVSGRTDLEEFGSSYESDVRQYHQYYVSGNYRSQKLHVGTSIDYMRDAGPLVRQEDHELSLKTNYNPLKVRTFADYRFHRAHTLSAEVSWSPIWHTLDYEERRYLPSYEIDTRQEQDYKSSYLQGTLQLKSRFLKHFENDLVGAYNWGEVSRETFYATSRYSNGTEQFGASGRDSYNVWRRHLLLRNTLSYNWSVGESLTIRPFANFVFRNISHSQADESRSTSLTDASVGAFSTNRFWYRTRYWTMQPALDITWRNYLNLNGGVVFSKSTYLLSGDTRKFPFASVSADVLQLLREGSHSSLKLFASYARSENLGDDQTTVSISENNEYLASLPVYTYIPSLNTDAFDRTTFVMGAHFGLLREVLRLGYSYNGRRYPLARRAANSTVLQNYEVQLSNDFHRLSFGAKPFSGHGFGWQSDLHAFITKVEVEHVGQGETPLSGDYLLDSDPLYFQWANKWSYKDFFMGMDVMAADNQPYQSLDESLVLKWETRQTFSIQHLYLGKDLSLANGQKLNIYAYARNLFENRYSLLADHRVYCGVGLGWNGFLGK